ncbi:hypothetical protein WJX73_008294 [Symbiochloris irregularis]|uniref:Protein kinase domain-containing protein n=1 Tax=Symbiochloris irregularis TaxID=706552 RepID=A0AAW1NU66_9CHLO
MTAQQGVEEPRVAGSTNPVARRAEAAIDHHSTLAHLSSLDSLETRSQERPPPSAFAVHAGKVSEEAPPQTVPHYVRFNSDSIDHRRIAAQRQRSMRLRAEGNRALGTQDQANILQIPRDFNAKTGVKLTEGLFIGKHISSGLQGGVYELVDKDGAPVDVVVKVVHRHALLAEVEREWEVGTRLGFLAEPDGTLPGFMGTGSALRDSHGHFRGMILERLHGRCVDKVICTRSFADIQYVHDMLKCVFTALERAQSWLGFHHSDLRLANVMEILQHNEACGNDPMLPTIISDQKSENDIEKRTESDADSRSSSPQRLKHEFKVIDYGLANFEETYACGPDLYVDEARGEDGELQVQPSVPSVAAMGPGCALPIMLQRDDVDRLPSTSPIEKLYRFMWRRKGDVYHLLFNLGEWLDGRVWPEEDELDVLRLLDLIHHVTGCRLKAYYCSSENLADYKGEVFQDCLRCGPFNRNGASLHFLRRWHVRLAGWTHPSNPGLTAAEALTAPFFTKHRSLRTVVTGASTRYASWTKPHSAKRARHRRRVGGSGKKVAPAAEPAAPAAAKRQ